MVVLFAKMNDCKWTADRDLKKSMDCELLQDIPKVFLCLQTQMDVTLASYTSPSFFTPSPTQLNPPPRPFIRANITFKPNLNHRHAELDIFYRFPSIAHWFKAAFGPRFALACRSTTPQCTSSRSNRSLHPGPDPACMQVVTTPSDCADVV